MPELPRSESYRSEVEGLASELREESKGRSRTQDKRGTDLENKVNSDGLRGSALRRGVRNDEEKSDESTQKLRHVENLVLFSNDQR